MNPFRRLQSWWWSRSHPLWDEPEPDVTMSEPWLGHRDLCPTQWGRPCDCVDDGSNCICIKDEGDLWVLNRTGLLDADPNCPVHGFTEDQ